MAFRKVWYLIPSCDGCGLAWSFGDPACAVGIPPHFTSPAAAIGPLAADYGWQVVPRRLGRPLMACRRCAAAGVIAGTSGRRWLLAVAGWARRHVPFGPVRRVTRADLPAGHHPESATVLLGPEQEDLLSAIDDELFPDQ